MKYIDKILHDYLQQRFYKNNHIKYRKYFEEWVSNVTDVQLMYFEKERISILNQDKVKH